MGFLIDSLKVAFSLILHVDQELFSIVLTSVQVSIAACAISGLIGIPCGAIIATRTFPGKSLILLMMNTLMALPTVVIGLIGYALLSRRGPFGHLQLLYTPAGISLGLFVLALPITVNLTIAAIQSLDKRLFLTCKSLGAGPIQELLLILSEARFAVMAAVIIGFGRVISEVGIAMMLGGNIKGFTRTMTTAIALETSKGEFELGLALGLVLMFVALIVNMGLFLLQKR